MAEPRAKQQDQQDRRRSWSQPHVRLSIEFALLLLGAELTRTLPFPWRATGVLFAAAAVVQGIRALRAGRRARAASPDRSAPAGAGPILLGVGVVVAGLLLVWHVVLLILTPVVTAQERCSERALTRTAEQRCSTNLEEQVTDLIEQSG